MNIHYNEYIKTKFYIASKICKNSVFKNDNKRCYYEYEYMNIHL